MDREQVNGKLRNLHSESHRDLWNQWINGKVNKKFFEAIVQMLRVTKDIFDTELPEVTKMKIDSNKGVLARKRKEKKEGKTRGRRKRLKNDEYEEPIFTADELQDAVKSLESSEGMDRVPSIELREGNVETIIDLDDGSQVTFKSSKNFAKEHREQKENKANHEITANYIDTMRKVENRSANRLARTKQACNGSTSGIVPIINHSPVVGVQMSMKEASRKDAKIIKNAKITVLNSDDEDEQDLCQEIEADLKELNVEPVPAKVEVFGIPVPDKNSDEPGVTRLHWKRNRVVQDRDPSVMELVSVGDLNPTELAAKPESAKTTMEKGCIEARYYVQETANKSETSTTSMLHGFLNSDINTHPLVSILCERMEANEQTNSSEDFDYEDTMKMHAFIDTYTREQVEEFLTAPLPSERLCVKNMMCEGMQMNVADRFVLREYLTPEKILAIEKSNGKHASHQAGLCFLCKLKIANEFALTLMGNTSSLVGPDRCVAPFRFLPGAENDFTPHDCIFPKSNGLLGPLLTHQIHNMYSTTVTRNGHQVKALRYLGAVTTTDNRLHFQTGSGRL